MDARAISISIGPSILVHPDIREDPLQFVDATKIVPPLMQNMIVHYGAIFDNGEINLNTPTYSAAPSDAPPPPPEGIPPPPEGIPPPPTTMAPPPSDSIPPPVFPTESSESGNPET